MPSDDDWASLRDAAPSFAERWAATTAMSGYDPSLAGASIAELAIHLVAALGRGERSEYARVALALDGLYETLDPDDAGFLLSAGFLEDLMHEAEARGLPLEVLFEPLGPRAREAWVLAYAYTHGGRGWRQPL